MGDTRSLTLVETHIPADTMFVGNGLAFALVQHNFERMMQIGHYGGKELETR